MYPNEMILAALDSELDDPFSPVYDTLGIDPPNQFWLTDDEKWVVF